MLTSYSVNLPSSYFFCQLQEFDLTIKRPWRGNTNLPTEKKRRKERRKKNGPDLSRAIIERDRKENRDKAVDEYFSEDQGWELWGGKGRVSVEGTAGKGRVVDFVSTKKKRGNRRSVSGTVSTPVLRYFLVWSRCRPTFFLVAYLLPDVSSSSVRLVRLPFPRWEQILTIRVSEIWIIFWFWCTWCK